MCRHVAEGVACGFHAAPVAGDPWPDACCDACFERLEAAGEWTEEAEALADVQVLCTSCYEAARDRNQRVPALARGLRPRLTEAERAALLQRAFVEMERRQAASKARWGWDRLPHWHFDDEAATLTFYEPDGRAIVADCRLVGSFSTRTSTFRWAWAGYERGAAVLGDGWRLRAFGEVRGLPAWTDEIGPAEEADGWERASLAGWLLGAEALYRAPFDHLYWFMLLYGFRTGERPRREGL